MSQVNPHFQELKRAYIFPIIEKKLEELKKKYSDAAIVNLGVGDIALPLAPTIVAAICKATEEMGQPGGIHGYGPSEGYRFLKEAIVKHEFASFGIATDEIFISDGINSDASNIQELFHSNTIVGVPDPAYPVYLDVNIMAGRGDRIVLLPCTEASRFVPLPPKTHCDFIYLCSPHNPTGVAMNKKELAAWVAYAKKERAVLLYDNAYAAFVTSPDTPKTIFEIEGAKEVAIEFRSFSKTAGFTGLRCAYTILPKSVMGYLKEKPISLHSLWDRRQSIKSNGVSYPIQRGAEASFSPQGKKETSAQIHSYLEQAKFLKEGLTKMGFTCFGGSDSPYVWWKTPNNMPSWEFFDLLLEKCHLISIPGAGFGASGEGYVRLSAFTTHDKAREALSRIQRQLQK